MQHREMMPHDSIPVALTVDAFLTSFRDGLNSLDLIRRTTRMILECTLFPLREVVEAHASTMLRVCRNVEDAMTTCLADTTLEHYVNSGGVADMLRETEATWCNLNTLASTGDANNGVSASRAMELQHRLHATLSQSKAIAAGAQTQLVKSGGSATSPAEHPTALVLLLIQLLARSVCAFSERVVLHCEGSELLDADCSPQVSPTFDLRCECAVVMDELRGDNAMQLVLTDCELPIQLFRSILVSLRNNVRVHREIAVEGTELLNEYSAAAEAKETELSEMAKWYLLSAQASREWHKESSRRETARQSAAQRVHAMQRELDRMSDEEQLLRHVFVTRWASYLPKSGFPNLLDVPEGMTITAKVSNAA